MSGGPRFPKQPLAGREHAFRGPDGTNPFADAATGDAPRTNVDDGNLFAPSVPAEFVRDRGLYDALLPHRGPLVFRLGLLGFLGSGFSVLVLGPILWFVWSMLRNLSLIAVSGAMLVCIATIYVGRADLKAIEAGAMNATGERATRRGYRLAWLGFGLGLIAWSALVVSLFNSFGPQ